MPAAPAPTVAFTTLGCRLNQAESDAMAEQLAAAGVRADADGAPGIVVINTCTVTREATKASRSAIRRAVRDHPGARVVVIGCYAESDRAEVEAMEGVDAVLGNTDKERFAEALGLRTRPLLQIGGIPATRKVRANLKVQTGCDEWCSFCIIPATRGPLRSFPHDALVRDARARAEAGARELVLTGVHLGKYAYDAGGDERALVRLLRALTAIDGVWRIRLSSILSNHLTDEVIGLMASDDSICRHLHVPLQSGDDGVLAAMNRPYRIGDYVSSVRAAAAALPGLALATDVIVGFPGETDAAFERTMDVVRDIGFSKLHVFRYSPRPGTAAAARADAVPPETAKERSKRLIDLGNEMRTRFLGEHTQKPLEVLVEDEREVEGVRVCSGQTSDYVRVWFEGRNLVGALVEVRGGEVRADGIRFAGLMRVIRR